MPDKERKDPQKERERLNRIVQTVAKASRDDADLTQQELADKIGLSRDQVANMESGRREVSVSDLIMMSKALGLDPRVLLERMLRW